MSPEDEAELRLRLQLAVQGLDPTRETECAGKFPHASHSAAHHSMRGMQRGRVTAYRCHHCGAWHVGSQTMPSAQRKRPRMRQVDED
ncbi:MAG: hypothetical protein A3E01_00030 [Gammaproteobacteria bacterium RIFCSPHIGHO2_12_FULL_63_22]|nr:MAG: hypothetical protein A3E01_00030 [Gammaproteobacteria bacterium RIFCSPHIGHO2_12_FULL_63_22]